MRPHTPDANHALLCISSRVETIVDTAYLDTLPALHSGLDSVLADGEKVVFATKLSCFGTETDAYLGGQMSKLYLTNRRIVADNTAGLWDVDLLTDIASCEISENGIPFFKSTVVCVNLNKELVYGNEQGTLQGFRFYFKKKKDAERFVALVSEALD